MHFGWMKLSGSLWTCRAALCVVCEPPGAEVWADRCIKLAISRYSLSTDTCIDHSLLSDHLMLQAVLITHLCRYICAACNHRYWVYNTWEDSYLCPLQECRWVHVPTSIYMHVYMCVWCAYTYCTVYVCVCVHMCVIIKIENCSIKREINIFFVKMQHHGRIHYCTLLPLTPIDVQVS